MSKSSHRRPSRRALIPRTAEDIERDRAYYAAVHARNIADIQAKLPDGSRLEYVGRCLLSEEWIVNGVTRFVDALTHEAYQLYQKNHSSQAVPHETL
jgi:hypothetical protein